MPQDLCSPKFSCKYILLQGRPSRTAGPPSPLHFETQNLPTELASLKTIPECCEHRSTAKLPSPVMNAAASGISQRVEALCNASFCLQRCVVEHAN